MVIVRTPFSPDSGRYDPSMVFALVTQSGSGAPLSSIDAFTTSAIEGVGTAEPMNETLRLLDREFEGWRFTIDDGQSDGPHYLVSAHPFGVPGPTAWQPFPHAELFLSETPAGLLVVGSIARSDGDIAAARSIFNRVAPTLVLAQPLGELEPPSFAPPGGDVVPPPDPAPKPDGWPPLLTGLNKRLDDGGEFTTMNLGTAMSFIVPETWWVQVNFPTWFILGADESFGPGDRGVIFRAGADALVAIDRQGVVGEPTPFDLSELVANPPTNLEVLESEETIVGGAEGMRVRLRMSDGATCAATDPCEYLLTMIHPFPPQNFRKGYIYDVWDLRGGLSSPVVIVAETPAEEWLSIAQDVVDTIAFDLASVDG